MNKTMSKSQKEKLSVLAMLDAEDSKIDSNPGLNAKATVKTGEFETMFQAATKEQDQEQLRPLS